MKEHFMIILKSLWSTNASEDESLDIIKEYQAVLPIKVIRNDENLSFQPANNIGANLC